MSLYYSLPSIDNAIVFIVNLNASLEPNRWLNGDLFSNPPSVSMLAMPPTDNINYTGTLWLAIREQAGSNIYQFQNQGINTAYLAATPEGSVSIGDDTSDASFWELNPGAQNDYYPSLPWGQTPGEISYTWTFMNQESKTYLYCDATGTVSLESDNSLPGSNWLILPAYGVRLSD